MLMRRDYDATGGGVAKKEWEGTITRAQRATSNRIQELAGLKKKTPGRKSQARQLRMGSDRSQEMWRAAQEQEIFYGSCL